MGEALSLEDRFWSKVDKRGPDDCWPWTSTKSASGYGQISVRGKFKRASRVAWEIAHGKPFPDGLYALHRCDNPSCVNPAHIWAGTLSENTKDAYDKGRVTLVRNWQHKKITHCKNGHPLSGDNLLPLRRNWRECRTCRKQYSATSYQRLKAKRLAAVEQQK